MNNNHPIVPYQEFVLAVERAKSQDKEWPLINEALAKLKQTLTEPAEHCEKYRFTSGLGQRFYVSPDGNFLIWEKTSPTAADEAHRGLAHALAAAESRIAQLELENLTLVEQKEFWCGETETAEAALTQAQAEIKELHALPSQPTTPQS